MQSPECSGNELPQFHLRVSSTFTDRNSQNRPIVENSRQSRSGSRPASASIHIVTNDKPPECGLNERRQAERDLLASNQEAEEEQAACRRSVSTAATIWFFVTVEKNNPMPTNANPCAARQT